MSEPQASTPLIAISVVYALPEHQEVVKLAVPPGTSVAQAVSLAQSARHFPQVDIGECAIFGQRVQPDQLVRAGDRIEILRPLLIDPKESRRRAAARHDKR